MVTWDPEKRKLNILKHGIDLAELEIVFDLPMETNEDRTSDYAERRLRSFCWFKGRVVVLVWADQGEDIRLISCRNGDRRETRKYFETTRFIGR
jgi:uncharacterized DUF497 family protein